MHCQRERSTGIGASAPRIAVVGVGVGGTLTLSRLAERADWSWSGATIDIVDRPETLGRGGAFGSDSDAAAVNTSAHRLEALSPSFHSFRTWQAGLAARSTDLDERPMPRSVYGDYLAFTLGKAVDRLRTRGVRVRLHPMHASAVRMRANGIAVLGDTRELPTSDIAVVAPGVWAPPPPASSHAVIAPYPLRTLRARLGSTRSVAVLGSGLTAVDVACALDDGRTRVHLLSRSGTLPRVQVDAARTGSLPRYLTAAAVRESAVWHELTAHAVLALLDHELARFGRSLADIGSEAGHAEHWSDPLADPTDLACYHALSATNDALNTAFALLPDDERRTLREALGSNWFRYRVRVPFSRWRQLRDMQSEGRLVLHRGVDARDGGLDDIATELGVDRMVSALGQSSKLSDGPALVADLAASGLVDCDESGQGLVDPATGRALTPGGGPRDDLLLVGQVAAGSYFTVSALDVVAGQADRAAQTIAGLIESNNRHHAAAARRAA